jgi:hypothetical protein
VDIGSPPAHTVEVAKRRKPESEPAVARVMTFTIGTATDFEALVYSLKTQLRQVYEKQPGFCELLAVHKPEGGQVIAITLWSDRESAENAKMLADTVTDRIARVMGTVATHDLYDVVGRLSVD